MIFRKLYFKFVMLIMSFIAAGILLLTAAYMLPTDRMKSHVADSDELFNYEGIYPQIIQGYKSSQLDNYTDGLMYATAIHPGSGKPLKDALRNARYEYEDTNMVQSLNDYANDVSAKEDLRYEMIYPRYWHGYLIFLKPLLFFFNVSEIRMINMVLQGGLLLLLLFLVRRRMGERWQIPVLLMAAVLNPIVLPLSLQFSWVYYTALIGGIALLYTKCEGGGKRMFGISRFGNGDELSGSADLPADHTGTSPDAGAVDAGEKKLAMAFEADAVRYDFLGGRVRWNVGRKVDLRLDVWRA